MHVTIAKEITPSGPVLELMMIVWAQVRPAGTAKGAKVGVVRCGSKEIVNGCIKIKKFSGSTIGEISSDKKCFIPILKRHGGSGE
jgi:hypothetical protein